MTRLSLLRLDDRLAPSVVRPVAVGSGPGVASAAAVYEVSSNQPRFTVQPFGGFAGGVRTAVADVTADGVPDLICAAGAGGGPHVKVFDGVSGNEVRSFFAFDPGFTGGVQVAAGDVNDDGAADIIVAAGAGGGPHVRVVSGKDGSELRSFFPYDPAFRGGLSVAAGDVNADGRADIVTGAGQGGGPHVRAFSGASGKELFSRFAYAANFTGGVSVAAADTGADGGAEIITAAGAGGGPHVRVLAADGTELSSFFASTPTDTSGVTVAAADVTGDGKAELFTRSGTVVSTYDAASLLVTGRRTIPASGTLAVAAEGEGDITADWNRAVLQVVREARLSPPVVSRVLAITHLAMFDAANGVTREFQPYLSNLGTPAAGASAEAAVNAAAHRVLGSLLPTYAARWENLLGGNRLVATAAREAGEAFGRTVGDAYLAARANDGSGATVPYTPSAAPGRWNPTPPAFALALLPGWGNVTPFGVTSASQFAPGAPPALTSAEYAAAFNGVKALGSRTSTARTADQTDLALFWADNAGTVTPPGHWNVILRGRTAGDGRSLTAHARAFALLNAAQADAAITCWFVKYRDDLWRPITAIARAGEDGNPATAADAGWEPLITTPPFPSYTSGHSTFSSAAAAVLQALYGTTAFRTTSDALVDGNRAFPTFAAAAAEAGMSRIYGGIHYQFDNTGGLTSGKNIGEWVATRLMRPV